MKYYFLIFLFFALRVNAQSGAQNLDAGRKHTAMYVLRYYYPETPGKILFKRAYRRVEEKDGGFCLVDYDPSDTGIILSRSCFDRDGIPVDFGDEKNLTQIFKDSVRLSFKGKDTTILMNTAKELKDATSLWFWKHTPKISDTVIVGVVRKNFITKSIDLVRVAYVYCGKEKITVLGKMEACYKVKSFPLNGSKGVYDERWFDKKGMLVKEQHTVGKDGSRIGELTEIIN